MLIFSMALPAQSGPRTLVQFRNLFYTDGRTPWMSDQSVSRPLPKHRKTQNKRIHTPNIHALSGIRIHDPSVRESEYRSCLRPHGHCDRHVDIYTTSFISRMVVQLSCSFFHASFSNGEKCALYT
jgi:hypothetical protein